jgi:hypothetical protein
LVEASKKWQGFKYTEKESRMSMISIQHTSTGTTKNTVKSAQFNSLLAFNVLIDNSQTAVTIIFHFIKD